jgi:hypothetical protein
VNRLTDNDRNWGPLTWGPWHNCFSLILSSGDEEEGEALCSLRVTGFGRVLRLTLPKIIQPYRIRHEASWDEATQKRLGRNHWFETFEREYGFSLSEMGNGYDFLQIKLGAQTHDSSTTKSWSKHLPWKQWDCVRHSIYTPSGRLFATEQPKKWDEFYEMKQKCPASRFLFTDYDGEEITATCIVEEREWHRGESWFKWLRHFYPSKIRRDLDLRFSSEVGPGKGSWKGGTIGHGIEMIAGETPEQAFRRYCDAGYERKGRTTGLTFIGKAKLEEVEL